MAKGQGKPEKPAKPNKPASTGMVVVTTYPRRPNRTYTVSTDISPDRKLTLDENSQATVTAEAAELLKQAGFTIVEDAAPEEPKKSEPETPGTPDPNATPSAPSAPEAPTS